MPMSTIENTGQMVSFHVLSRQNLPSLWHSHLHVDSWCPRNSSSSASSANSATASKSILSWCLNRRKNSFYNRGAFGVGQSTNWFPPGFFQVWIFGVGCFMFKHPHDETIEKIEHFEAVLNFSVVTFFLATALFLKNTGERLKYVKDRQISSCAGIDMLDHLPSNIRTVGAVEFQHFGWKMWTNTSQTKPAELYITPCHTRPLLHQYPVSWAINTPNSQSLP